MQDEILAQINPNLAEVIPYQAGKTIAEVKRLYHVDKVVKLGSNECPLPPSPAVIAAIQENLPALIRRYPEDPAPLLRKTLAEDNQILPEQLTFGGGISEVAELLINAFAQAGANLVTAERNFSLYRILAKIAGMKTQLIPEVNWSQDLEAMFCAINAETRIIVLINPNNPTGHLIEKNALMAFIEKVPAHILIIVDEAYHEFMDQAEYASMIPMIKHHPNVAVVRTFSKVYGLAGLRFGYAVTHRVIADRLNRLRKPFNVPNLTLTAALAAFLDQDYVEQVKKTNRDNRTFLLSALQLLDIKAINNSANFLTIEVGEKAPKIAEALLARGVIVRPLLPYNMPDHLRVSIGTREELQVFLEHFEIVLKEYRHHVKS